MDHHSPEFIKKQVAIAISVFAALMFLTVLTVAVSYLHLNIISAGAVALAVATFKASLVVAYFMHLVWEPKAIYRLLIMAGFFFFAMVFLCLFNEADLIPNTLHLIH